jgi:hypothetical protein
MPDITTHAVLGLLTHGQLLEYCRLYHLQIDQEPGVAHDTAQGRIILRCHVGSHIGCDQLYFTNFVGWAGV